MVGQSGMGLAVSGFSGFWGVASCGGPTGRRRARQLGDVRGFIVDSRQRHVAGSSSGNIGNCSTFDVSRAAPWIRP